MSQEIPVYFASAECILEQEPPQLIYWLLLVAPKSSNNKMKNHLLNPIFRKKRKNWMSVFLIIYQIVAFLLNMKIIIIQLPESKNSLP